MSISFLPELNSNIAIGNKTFKWNHLAISDDSIVTTCKDSNTVFLLATYISVDQWVNATIKLNSNALFEVYIDNELKKSKTNNTLDEASVSMKLNKGKHPLILKFLTTSNITKFKGSISFDKEIPPSSIQTSLNPKRIISIDDILLGEKITSFQVSPSGNYLLVNYTETVDISGNTKKYTVLKNLKTNLNVTVFRNQNISLVKWLPRTDRLSYLVSQDLFVYDITSATEKLIASDIENLSDYQWSPKEDFIVYTEDIEAENPEI
ncbi:MAG: hypothetical protein HC831_09360 [Chloroflexia bacterium]|nr:hypothetical protein [Chloroflexia bacterium]